MRFAIYGIEDSEFEGDLTLNNLQRLADVVFHQTGKHVQVIVANHETRRQLLKYLFSGSQWLVLADIPIEADRRFPRDLICMRPA